MQRTGPELHSVESAGVDWAFVCVFVFF